MSAVAKRKIEENIENSENNEVKKSKVGTPKNKKKSDKSEKSEQSNEKQKKDTKPLSSVQNNMKQTKLSFFKVAPKSDNDEWLISDFLYDKEWKSLLEDEFNKDYFKTIHETIKPGYKKDIVRPPKELVFNALNSTKIKDVCIQYQL